MQDFGGFSEYLVYEQVVQWLGGRKDVGEEVDQEEVIVVSQGDQRGLLGWQQGQE